LADDRRRDGPWAAGSKIAVEGPLERIGSTAGLARALRRVQVAGRECTLSEMTFGSVELAFAYDELSTRNSPMARN
jgi:hypothetical protein